MEKVTYYTSCENCEELTGTATVLEGIGDYDRDGNTMYGADCSGCGNETVIENWLDDEEGAN